MPRSDVELERPADVAIALLADRLKLDDGVGFLLRVLNARATALYEALTGQADVTPQQFGALLTLHQRGPMTLTELANAIRVDRSTLSEMTRRMVARGLMDRRRNGADARSAVVSLAPAGTEAVLRLVAGAAATQNALMEDIPESERRSLLRYLKLMARASSSHGATVAAPPLPG